MLRLQPTEPFLRSPPEEIQGCGIDSRHRRRHQVQIQEPIWDHLLFLEERLPNRR